MPSSISAKRFNTLASGYRTSAVHRGSPTLERLRSLLPVAQSMCDVACGAGHAGLFLASETTRLVAVDPAPQMLEQVHLLAAGRESLVETLQAFAEELPLPSASFDVVVTRLAAHHFTDLESAFSEMVRILRPGGHLAVIDMEGDAEAVLDDFNHRIEMLHDPTHVRAYPVSRWQDLFQSHGLHIDECQTRNWELPGGLTVTQWCELGQSGETATEAIRKHMREAPRSTLEALDMTQDADGDFRIPVRTFLLVGSKRGFMD